VDVYAFGRLIQEAQISHQGFSGLPLEAEQNLRREFFSLAFRPGPVMMKGSTRSGGGMADTYV